MPEQEYKYRREDFGELPVVLLHLTIYLNFLADAVEASNCLEMSAREPLEQIELDARDLKILKVEWLEDRSERQDHSESLGYTYRQTENKLIVKLPRPVRKGERFRLRTVTQCAPSDHILEGVYKDTTPPGAPQQYVSQCQQWGFQRIMPILDDCRAKCTMTTTIEADAAYTHLISNGNIDLERNPEGKPVPGADDPTRQVITYQNPVPMAPYLFLVCAGTWDTLVDEVTYDSGKTVRLEYLVPPGRADDARIPMEILKESILWVKKTQGYEYTGDTYRTICMDKSNFGGMENVGNTTIVTDAALVDKHTLDQSLLYAHSVIVHEFEHNQCGSETTMETPFDVWLNEAYTVDVERGFIADVFDPAFIRLIQVDGIRNPLIGPLAIEDGGRAGRIVREGFNDPDELIDGVTYVKAAEVIRMLRLILGPENFRAGRELYFSRHRNSNANTDQFFECFEEVSGQSLDQFKAGWLTTIGYPKVTVQAEYLPQDKRFSIRLTQENDSGLPSFHLPVETALVDFRGNTIPGSEKVFQLREAQAQFAVEDVPAAPAFASLNRGYSFYGTLKSADASPESLTLQALLDPNLFNRVEAMRQVTDIQRVRLLSDPGADVDEQWLSLYGEVLSDEKLSPGLKAYFLRIDEQPVDRRYSTWYSELVAVREKLMMAVNSRYINTLVDLFHALDTYVTRESPKDGIEDRMLKNVLLTLIAVADTPESHLIILNHYDSATTATDRVSSLVALNRSSAVERRDRLEEAYEKWHVHLSGYANYLRIVSGGACEDVWEMIADEKKRWTFDITHPTWSRALFLTMAMNTKMVWTDRGIDWVADTVIELATINAYTASRLLNTFQQARRLKPDWKLKVMAALERIKTEVSRAESPSVYGQATAYLGD